MPIATRIESFDRDGLEIHAAIAVANKALRIISTNRCGHTVSSRLSSPVIGISLHQMVQFGSNSSQGTLFRASQFIHEELPIRLAHRVKELAELPDQLNEMPSINKVKDWYAQSFEDLTTMERPKLTSEIRAMLKGKGQNGIHLPQSTRNLTTDEYLSTPRNTNMRRSVPVQSRYYGEVEDVSWPPEITSFNDQLAKSLNIIKRRHDSVVTTMGNVPLMQ